MISALRILLLEDDPGDAALIQELLEQARLDCDITRVQTREEFLAAVENTQIDVILADYRLPSFDGLSALKIALDVRPDVPFIFVSGTLGEDVAIEALKDGATDYVVKSRLSRLVPSLQRALRDASDRAERKKAEEALRQSEMYLAEAQRLSHTGSFGWNPLSGEIYWSDETYRIFECDPATKPTLEVALARCHPDDLTHLQRVLQHASTEGQDFSTEHRLLLPGGSVKHLRVVARRAPGEQPDHMLFIGAVTDITERKRAEGERERLRQLEADIARMNRVSTMGELAASLAHEIKQPIAGVVISAEASLRWLQRDPPDVDEARGILPKIVREANRAVHIIERNRSLYGGEAPQREPIDLNEVIREMVALLKDAAVRHSVSVRSDLDPALPTAVADRVQLQQVLMNLMLNGIEAMKGERGELNVSSKTAEDGNLLIAVRDSGVGLPDGGSERIFEAFFTTKPHGTGMGLSIAHRIIESHGDRLWASANDGRGATFQFTLPHQMS